MLRRVLASAGLLALGCVPAPIVQDAGQLPDASTGWRSALYPLDWSPAFTDDAGRFLPDFSWAGYANGEREPSLPALQLEVANDGGDSTAAIQAAIDAVQAADGGVVLLVRSMQFGWGYVIGTRTLEVATTSELGLHEGTAPRDFVEGLDAGLGLEPRSLYEAQLLRRRGN